jgi:hypothetical protein
MKVAALMAVAGLLLSQGPEARTLKFAWPAGTVAAVETDYLRRSGVDPAPEVARLRMMHRLSVRAHPEGLDIRLDDQRHLDSSGDFRHAAGTVIQFWTPQTIVAKDGTFLRIEGGERVQDLVVATLAPYQQFADAAPALRAFITPMLDGNYLESRQKDEWNRLIWQWIGISSNQTRIETSGTDQIMPGIEVPTKRTIEVVGRSRCTRGGGDYECITVEMRTSMDGVAMKAIFDALRQAAGPQALASQPLDFEQLVRVTLETATMLPHDSLETRTMHGTSLSNGNSAATTDFESRGSAFTYQPAP